MIIKYNIDTHGLTKTKDKHSLDSEAFMRMYISCPAAGNCVISIRSPNQIAQPLRSLIFVAVYAIQEQFSKHIDLHSLRFIVLFTQEFVASGNFKPTYLTNPSPFWQSSGLFRTHP
jgi:hypothetical protein